ncbi:MAG: GGDEF domain-containing protein, partial [Halomonas sp.]|uniref:GGDEF domain-containing protein n=1 Tax=Halomonas sp. TaxID=1486246 RepID=UPI0028700C56
DHLTGTYNRRAFDSALRQAIFQAELGDDTFSLLLFDIDHFKDVNDRHGHDTGDAILKQLADRVSNAPIRGQILSGSSARPCRRGVIGISLTDIKKRLSSVVLCPGQPE